MADTTIDWSRCDGFEHQLADGTYETLTVEEMRERIRTTGSTLTVERTQPVQAGISGEANKKGEPNG